MRKMYDVGSFAVRSTAPLLARGLKSDDETYQESLAFILAQGTTRPEESDDVTAANVYRILSWLVLLTASLALLGVTAVARTGSPPAVVSVLEAVMKVEATVLMTIAGLILTSVWRFILARILAGELRVRLEDGPSPRPGLVGWLTIPNSVDLVTALIFAACMAPQIFP